MPKCLPGCRSCFRNSTSEFGSRILTAFPWGRLTAEASELLMLPATMFRAGLMIHN
jgi:hypothetical protein